VVRQRDSCGLNWLKRGRIVPVDDVGVESAAHAGGIDHDGVQAEVMKVFELD